jgi:predicted nucleotidyltransferase
MRLTDKEIEAIKKTAVSVFDETVEIRLFGSRTDDSQKGGDIDPEISGADLTRMNTRFKIEFLVLLKLKIGEQKIDVILDRPSLCTRQSF